MLRNDIVTKDAKKIQFEYYLLVKDKITGNLIGIIDAKYDIWDIDMKKNNCFISHI